MSDFTFNGVSASSLGLTINQMPQGARGAQRFTSASIPGRDSVLYRAETAFEDYTDSIVINCMGNNPRMVLNWLKGSGWCTSTDNVGKRRFVRFYNEVGIERWRPYNSIEDIVTAQMTCEPFQYDASDPLITLTNGQVIAGQGDWYARPLLHIAGQGDITVMVNGTTFLITISGNQAKNLHIDADAKMGYVLVDGEIKSAAENGITVTLMSDDPDTRWGRLNYNESNTVSWSGSNVSYVNMHPRWRWF